MYISTKIWIDDNFQCYFSDVNDIDVFTGIMIEPLSKPAIVGPTIACILSRQFHALKYGDRFYFESIGNPNGFTQGISFSCFFITYVTFLFGFKAL